MTIHNSNFSTVVFLHELLLQCNIVLAAGEYLKLAANHWHPVYQGSNNEFNAAPSSIIVQATAFLSASASISKILFIGERKGKKHIITNSRCEYLITLLGNPILPALKKLSVINSWEHLDERLDTQFQHRSFESVTPIRISTKIPSSKIFVLRSFNPASLEIGYKDDNIQIITIINEASDISMRIQNALISLSTP